MTHRHHYSIRNGLLAGTVVIAMGLLGGAAAAQAAPVLCTVSADVTQTETTVTGTNGNDTVTCPAGTTVTMINSLGGNDTITGSNNLVNYTINSGDGNDTVTTDAGNDTINGDLGEDTLSGGAGNDTLVGSGADGSQDSLDGGDGTDNCQSPPEDSLAGCETTPPPPATGPGSATANGTDLCRAVNGTYTNVGSLGYKCLNIPVGQDHRAAEARTICVDQHHLVFVDVILLVRPLNGYTCLA
jgi:Ca2+-binding RTX toxin-like protein